ncbi:hypothetical protein [Mesorhizobium escarrei]|uniref:hypothetical protein n=1 Tax=Mesorhizobium escarrei TaxID=666018 RepID=UPI0020A7F819|nr:hypothetical protein [Mesorhizobium escarrei]
MIEVFMDESGIHDEAPAVTSSAVWARPSVWRKWTADWQKALHPISIFHASECHGRKREWKNFTRPERDEKVLRLLPLFPKHKLCGRFAGVHLDAFMQCMRDEPVSLKEFGDPYFACIHWAFRRVSWSLSLGDFDMKKKPQKGHSKPPTPKTPKPVEM